ncbi:helix-turn-helix domain-containing protein [Paenibacillus dendritiformis]|uniref:helix-turn-helix domain-containing protein n=1 Tax=Paenibacillus dendritiformis TaxID=130049 RepID=UPI00387E0BDA
MAKLTTKERRELQKRLQEEMRAATASAPKQPLFNKLAPTAQGESFIKTPSNLMHYVDMYPYGITTETLFLYQIIVNYFDLAEGCAYPSQYALARLLKKSVPTVKRHISLLESVGLIEIKRRGLGKSNQYVPLKPLEKEIMYDRYPKSLEYHDRFSREVEEYRTSDMKHKERIRNETTS